MTEEKKDEGWYFGKYAKKAASATWEGAKTVGSTVAEHPVAGTVGAIGGFIVAGPVGAVGVSVAAAGAAKAIKNAEDRDYEERMAKIKAMNEAKESPKK